MTHATFLPDEPECADGVLYVSVGDRLAIGLSPADDRVTGSASAVAFTKEPRVAQVMDSVPRTTRQHVRDVVASSDAVLALGILERLPQIIGSLLGIGS